MDTVNVVADKIHRSNKTNNNEIMEDLALDVTLQDGAKLEIRAMLRSVRPGLALARAPCAFDTDTRSFAHPHALSLLRR